MKAVSFSKKTYIATLKVKDAIRGRKPEPLTATIDDKAMKVESKFMGPYWPLTEGMAR